MFRTDLVAIDFFAAELAVKRVQIQPVFPRNQRQRLVQIRAEFVRGAGFAGIIPRDRDTAAEALAGVFEAADVVALPAVQGNRDGGESGHGRAGVHAEAGVAGFRQFVGAGNGVG